MQERWARGARRAPGGDRPPPDLPPGRRGGRAAEGERGPGWCFGGRERGPRDRMGGGAEGREREAEVGGESESRGVKSYLGSVPTSCKGLQTRGFESPPEASALLSRFQGEMKAAGTGTADAEWPRLPAERGFGSI